MVITQTMSETELPTRATRPPRPRRRRSPVPMYQVLKADLEREIRAGNLQPGQLVPSESELIARYQVSSTTARRCLDEMEGAGLVERKRGKGTYVSTLARVLNKRRIAVVVKDLFSLTHPFLATVVGTIEHTLERAGIHVVIVRAHVDESSAGAGSHLLELVLHEGADQAMLLSNMPLDMVLPLVEHGVKCLGVNTRYLDPRIPHVSHDFAASLNLGMRELLGRGHRRIVILRQEVPMMDRGVMNSSSLHEKVYADLRRDFSDLPEKPEIRRISEPADLTSVVLEAMASSPAPTAFHCWDELAGLEVMRILFEAGYAVPGDVSVVGSKLLPASPVACVDVPLVELARESAEAMLNWSNGTTPENRLIPPNGFLTRETIAKAP